MRPVEALSHRGTSARRGSPMEREGMPTDTTPWSFVRQKAAKWFQATKPRRLKRTAMGLLIIVLLSGVTCYWLTFIRVTNGGLTFENKLLIPDQLFGAVVDGRRQFDLTVAEGSREFLPGKQTPTAGVNGPFLGPTLRLRRGEDVDLIVQNNLDEMTTMHWHGMHVPARMDGTPHQKIGPGGRGRPAFRWINRPLRCGTTRIRMATRGGTSIGESPASCGSMTITVMRWTCQRPTALTTFHW